MPVKDREVHLNIKILSPGIVLWLLHKTEEKTLSYILMSFFSNGESTKTDLKNLADILCCYFFMLYLLH